jgi:hypothetical protein
MQSIALHPGFGSRSQNFHLFRGAPFGRITLEIGNTTQPRLKRKTIAAIGHE